MLVENVEDYVYLGAYAKHLAICLKSEMKRSMHNTTYNDRRTNFWVRKRTQFIDIINNVRTDYVVLGMGTSTASNTSFVST